MRILVTGHRGRVDLLDHAAVRRAADGCAAIVHLGAIPNDNAGSPEQIMAVNVLGTWHVRPRHTWADRGASAGAGRQPCAGISPPEVSR